MVLWNERLGFCLLSCTFLVAACQALVFFLYPFLSARSYKNRFQQFSKPLDSPKFNLSTDGASTSTSPSASWRSACFPAHRFQWAVLMEAFFLALASSTLIADAIFHLIPAALVSALATILRDKPLDQHVDENPSSALFLRLGFWTLGGMLIVGLVEAVVHLDISFKSLFLGCVTQELHSSITRIDFQRTSCEKLELCDVHHSSSERLVPDSPDTVASSASECEFQAILHHHNQPSNIEVQCNKNRQHRWNHHYHREEHHGFCDHGFSHLILDEYSSPDEKDEDMDGICPTNEVFSSRKATQSQKFKERSPPVCTVSVQSSLLESSTCEQTSEFSETDIAATDNYDSVETAILERPQTAPACLLDSDAIMSKARGHDRYHNQSDNSAKQKMLRSVAWANLIAELLHNFIDGLTIGIAFLSGSRSTGIATTIAIFAHEVPSQIADFIILSRGGFSPSIAYCLNFAVALAIHIGAVAALLGTPASYHTALQMLAAGNFLCLGLSMMLPQLRELLLSSNQNSCKTQLFQINDTWQSTRLMVAASIGLLGGVGLITGLAFLEI